MDDPTLPRLVTVGLVFLTTVALLAGAYLKVVGAEATDLITIAAAGVGALAGFIARGQVAQSLPVPVSVVPSGDLPPNS